MNHSFTIQTRHKGTVLIITIWVVLVLAGLAMVFARTTRVNSAVAANHIAALEAECILEGAQAYVMTQLQMEEDETAPPPMMHSQ